MEINGVLFGDFCYFIDKCLFSVGYKVGMGCLLGIGGDIGV